MWCGCTYIHQPQNVTWNKWLDLVPPLLAGKGMLTKEIDRPVFSPSMSLAFNSMVKIVIQTTGVTPLQTSRALSWLYTETSGWMVTSVPLCVLVYTWLSWLCAYLCMSVHMCVYKLYNITKQLLVSGHPVERSCVQPRVCVWASEHVHVCVCMCVC